MAKPKIRLKGFEGEWKPIFLSDIAKFSKGHGYSKSDLSEHGSPIILYGRLYTNYSTEIDDVDTYVEIKDGSVLSKGGEIIIPASGETPEDIACASVIKSEGIILGGDLNVLSIEEKEYNPTFTALSISYGKVHNELAKYAQGKTVVHLHNAEISKATIHYPQGIEEQQSIANYFKSLDSMIQGATKKIASLKQMKQACLVSMFPQAGETTPRVRFKGFKGEWIYARLGDLFTERVESNIDGEMLSVTMNSGIIKASENGRFDNSNSDKSHYKVVKVNDIAYNSMRMWQGASGCSPYEGIVSPAYTVISPSEGIDSQFFAYMFKTLAMIKVFRLHSQGLTSDTWNLKYPAFSKISVLYPKDINEQQQIASFFRSMDSQISLQEQRLEKLKQIKSACLDKMFV
ncbi:MAG: restriction endonuclease subunit S [Prevotella sp.]|nr:restriction endonuclease subunit S [Prevotella sp.]